MRLLSLLGAAALVPALSFAACGGGDTGASASGEEGLRVVTSLGIFADLVGEVGGKRVEVRSLLPAGADPHTFEPSPSAVREVTEADIVFVNGLGLEGTMRNVIEANLPPDAPLVALAEEVVAAGVEALQGDPHLWLDPTLAARYIEVIAAELSAVAPADAGTYERRAADFRDELLRLDTYVKERIGSIAPAKRKLVTTHAAFAYFAEHYGLALAAVVAPSPSREASPADIADLARIIRDTGVPAVFVEPQVESEGRILEQLAADVGVQVCTLYSDSLDDKVRSYLEMVRFNADELVRCLGGEAGG